jgi:glutamine synthetase
MTGFSPDPGSFAARHQLQSKEKRRSISDVLDRLEAENIETVRVCFVDQHGIMRGKTLVASGLKSAFASGVAMTSTMLLKDTAHNTVFPVWQENIGIGNGHMIGASDFLLLPDPATFKVLPWSPHSAWILSDIYFPDGTEISYSTRQIAKKALRNLDYEGYSFTMGLEVEFYILKLEDRNLGHENSGRPEDPPETSLLTHGYQYLTDQRYDQQEQIIDTLRRYAEQLGLPVRSMEAEFGPSQIEFTFDAQSGLANADAMVFFRTMTKEVCTRNGFHATFMCRPAFPHAMASGWHLHQSLISNRTAGNSFTPTSGNILSPTSENWLAGLLSHAEESCLLSTPTINGFKRYQPYSLAPDRIQWGLDNRGAMLRVIRSEHDNSSRIENRVGDPAANPYLYLTSQIYSGLDGLKRKLNAPAAVENPYDSDAPKLPTNLGAAIESFSRSEFYQEMLGHDFVDYYSRIKHAEWDRYLNTISDWEQREYFSLF